MTEALGSTLPLDVGAIPAPDPAAEPDGFVVQADDGTRIHFLDWRSNVAQDHRADWPHARFVPVLLIHGLAQTAWIWTPVARRLQAGDVATVAMDLRGHGISDSPTGGYDPETLAGDAVAVAEGSGLIDPASDATTDSASRVVLAGHGFGAIIAAWTAAAIGSRCAGLVLVDGGWESVAATSEGEPDEFLRGLDEPPEILRSMAAFLADRRDFDPATWDADQERAARATVVEAHSLRLTPATRPHALAGSVQAMFDYDPGLVLPSVEAPMIALIGGDDSDGARRRALADVQHALAAAGRPSIRTATFPGVGHNLMRYRPREVTAAILELASTIGS